MIRFRRPLTTLCFNLAPILLVACSNGLSVECRVDRCDEVLAAASRVIPPANSRWVVIWGRGLDFHAEVHACYDNGQYFLVDVNGLMRAGLRDEPWSDPPCR